MKRLILIVLVCAPMMMLAQGRDGGAKKPGSVGGTELDLTGNRFIYGEVVLNTGAGATSARIDFGNDMREVVKSKENIVKMETLKAKRYTSIVDALNAMNSEGFKVVTSFTTETRQGTEAHIIMEKPNLASPDEKGRPQRNGK